MRGRRSLQTSSFLVSLLSFSYHAVSTEVESSKLNSWNQIRSEADQTKLLFFVIQSWENFIDNDLDEAPRASANDVRKAAESGACVIVTDTDSHLTVRQ